MIPARRQVVVLRSEDGTLKVWDIRFPTCQYSYDCGAAINTTVLHPNQMEIVTGDQTGCVKAWDLSMNAVREEHTPTAPIQNISLSGFVGQVDMVCVLIFHLCAV